MPKNIVVCCDGTGNEFGDSNSNVVKLCSTLIVDEHQQVSYYHPGVGTMGSPSARTVISKQWDVIKGLAFGYGITENMSDAYRYLMQTYEPGDNIYLFGFSRGAYTVRALGGLLHMYGLLHRGNEGLIPYITAKFASTSKRTQGMTHTFEVAEGFKQTYCQDVLIHFIGVWDTVSSVGWISDPVVIPFTASNPIMKIGRHAVSIDERRCFFRDNLWGKPFQPNDPAFRVEQDIKQVWFAGVHSDVGGSYPEGESGLSKITLEWMLREATSKGLRINEDEAKRILGIKFPAPFAPPDAADGQHESLTGPWWILECFPHFKYDKAKQEPHWKLPPLGDPRHMPDDVTVHQSVYDRMAAVQAYQPPTLLQRMKKPNAPPIKVEPRAPLFDDKGDWLPHQEVFSELEPNQRVQAILNFKVDANPKLQSPPDVWPEFPVLAAVLAVGATLLGCWKMIPLQEKLANVANGIGLPKATQWYLVPLELLVFFLLRQGFRKLYKWHLIDHYKKHRRFYGGPVSPDEPKPPLPRVYATWKAANWAVAGVLAAAIVWRVAPGNWLYMAIAAGLLLAGILSAATTVQESRAFNSLNTVWGRASSAPEYKAYQQDLQKRRRAKEHSVQAAAPAPSAATPAHQVPPSNPFLERLFSRAHTFAVSSALVAALLCGGASGVLVLTHCHWHWGWAVLLGAIVALGAYLVLGPESMVTAGLISAREKFLDGKVTVGKCIELRRESLRKGLLY